MTATTIRVQMAQRKDTAANWTAANPILLSGEIGYETDTEKFKIGDGTTNWNGLAYLPIPDGSGNLTITGNLEIGTTGTLTFEGSTANDFETTLAVTDPTADRTITLPDVSGTVVTTGDTGSVTSTMIADGTIVDADVSATAEIAVSKLANGTANQVIVTDGTDVSWSDDLTLAGNLTVNGTTTTINTQDLLVEDKNIIIGNVDTPSDVTADGGGITLKGATDKTINWIDATDAWTSSEHVDLASGKSYRINGTEVLSGTTLGSGVTGSSLTSVGTISSGSWQGTAIDAAYLDSTVVTTGDTGTVTSTMIADGTIVDGDINASAAIAGTKINPDFGSQNVVTTGTSTAASFIPTSSTVPTNGVYLPAANSVAISTNGTGRLFVDSSGNIGVGGTPNARLEVTTGAGTEARITSTVDNNADLTFYTNSVQRGIVEGNSLGMLLGTTGALPTIFITNNTERMRLDSSGRLGLGTSSPGRNLHVAGSGATALIESTGSTNADLLIGDGGVRYYGIRGVAGGGSLQIRNDTANTTLATFTSTGLVGVGTTSPYSALDIGVGTMTVHAGLLDFRTNDNVSRNMYIAANATDGQFFCYATNLKIGGPTTIFENPLVGERARIDSSGRLLVGTSSDLSGGDADARLQVNGDAGAQILLSRQDFSALTAGTLIGEVVFRSQASGVAETSALIKCEADATQGSGDKPGRLVFSVTRNGQASPTEALRIDNQGQLLTFFASGSNGMTARSASAAGTTYFLYRGMNSGTDNTTGGNNVFYVYTNGNVQNTNNSYAGISDIKLKENIVDAGSQWDDLKDLQVRKYNFKEGQTHTQIGLVAQEVELVSPGLVSETPDRDEDGNDLGTVTKSVNYSVLYMKAVKALQEAMERIETLEAKVAALESA